ncbi:hypothetical protein JO972_16635 [Verrucomicrobiaceae bacterium 5K15]|uniref:Uncharacterized protein n=1 Tax=Oceaniferula flava TaxID=2800421 RepID=A0AAE2SDX5_9BACT|nr:hypothetical protein [Oceaniferula flavus]MBK1856593.1 hypothetical protein [Oceaniferula flavus]MBM1137901.1 hypothetical protein [Oceaniferula flavus]
MQGNIISGGLSNGKTFFSARVLEDVRFSMMLTILRQSSFLRVPPEDQQHAADVPGSA